jgi:hypothetical protein
VLTRPRPDNSRSLPTIWRGVLLAGLMLLFVAAPARADDETASIAKLNKQALDAFDSLNFDQAKTLLDQALAQGASAGLDKDPSIARTHLNLGMLLIAGFQKRDDAIDHFKTALTIQPDITAPAGLFNPEVQAAFDEAKEKVKAEQEIEKQLADSQTRKKTDRAAAEPAATARAHEEETEAEDEGAAAQAGTGFFLSLGLGSGGGVAKGHLDANKDIMQNNMIDNSWSGGLAPSRLGHIAASVGYFVLPELLLSLDGRFQIVNGTSTVVNTPSCMPSCSAPSTGIAALARASWFFSPHGLRPFLSGGLGGGTIRQVVKLNLPPGQPTMCGSSGTADCVDTVTGGPFLIAVGGGVFYEIGSMALIGSLTANLGVPKVMLNIDATVGVGFHL